MNFYKIFVVVFVFWVVIGLLVIEVGLVMLRV